MKEAPDTRGTDNLLGLKLLLLYSQIQKRAYGISSYRVPRQISAIPCPGGASPWPRMARGVWAECERVEPAPRLGACGCAHFIRTHRVLNCGECVSLRQNIKTTAHPPHSPFIRETEQSTWGWSRTISVCNNWCFSSLRSRPELHSVMLWSYS